jgi:hypothetical protein
LLVSSHKEGFIGGSEAIATLFSWTHEGQHNKPRSGSLQPISSEKGALFAQFLVFTNKSEQLETKITKVDKLWTCFQQR